MTHSLYYTRPFNAWRISLHTARAKPSTEKPASVFSFLKYKRMLPSFQLTVYGEKYGFH